MEDNNAIVLYSKDDFLTGTKPYEDAYKSIGNKFELERAVERIADMAKLVGVRNFKTLFQEYCSLQKRNASPDYIDNASNFDGQEIELDAGIWVADESGVTREGRYGEEIACVHPIMPVQRLVNVDTGIEKLKIAYKKGRSWRSVICDRKQLATANQIVALADYGVAVTSETAKLLVQYIHDIENLNYEKIPESNSVSRLGWIGENGFSPYVENLIFDGDLSYKHYFESVAAKGSEDKWIDLIRSIRNDGNIPAKILVAASFASVLVGPCNCLPFFVHLWGGTETGKTVGLMLAASVWANPEMGKYIHTFNSTAVAQELSAGFVNSLPLMLDELQISKDKKDFDSMIYQLAEGVGKGRGQKTGGLQKTNTWNNCIMTTGEQPISTSSSGGGAVNRIIEINCEDVKIFVNPAKVVDIIRKNHGYAGRAFVKALEDPKMMAFAKDTQKSIYKDLTGTEITEKQALAASLILAADALVDMLIFKDGKGIAYRDLIPFLSNKSDVSANQRAYGWLQDWIAENSNKFNESSYTTDIWGNMETGQMHIIRSVFDKACQENGYNSQSLLSWLKRNDYIETGGKGYTKTKRINGMPCNCVILKIDHSKIEK